TGSMVVNQKGHLEIGGCDLVDLANHYGTPLNIMDESMIREKCRSYLKSMEAHYPDFEVIYAGKAFLTTAMCRLLQEEGLSLDVVSGGELYTALKADYPPEKIYFHGNNKTTEEINLALKSGAGRFVADSLAELELIDYLAGEMGKEAKILLRIKPGVVPDTHQYIQTGQIDSKFGLGLTDGQALEALDKCLELGNLEFKGFHCHIGSQIFQTEPFALAASIMMSFIREVAISRNIRVEELNLGGGLGIRYLKEDNPPSVEDYVKGIAYMVKKKAEDYRLPLPRIMIEPGRSIVGEGGVSLYRVGIIKDVPGIRRYVSVDGGMADNLRPALYKARYEAAVANKADQPSREKVSVAGKACESGDMLIWDVQLPPVERGDLVAIFSTGAYTYSMASNYNRLPRPAVVFVKDGESDLVVRRESYEDLVRNDLIPKRMEKGD
ncbi:MAG: diaminopimelate decarboxylase, partial [Candidatus Syntrophonatronum acetioxidans]